jgi:hypothetical protein
VQGNGTAFEVEASHMPPRDPSLSTDRFWGLAIALVIML